MDFFQLLRPWLDTFRHCFSCPLFGKKKSRYGYSVIRGHREKYDNDEFEYDEHGREVFETRKTSLISNVSVHKPLDDDRLELIYDYYDEILESLRDLKVSRILSQVPALGIRLTSQLADHSFAADGEAESILGAYFDGNGVEVFNREKEEILRQNLVYLASYTEHQDQLARELLQREVLEKHHLYYVTDIIRLPILKAIEIFKFVLPQKDAIGFLIGALKVTKGEGNNFVADIFIGNHFPDVGAELICKISLTPEFSPEFRLHGIPSNFRTLRTIPVDRQEILTAIYCSFIQMKGKTLLRSLQHCHGLQTLYLTQVKLKQDFRDKVHLPALKSFTLHVNKQFACKKDFFDCVTPEKVFQLLFFITHPLSPDQTLQEIQNHENYHNNNNNNDCVNNVWNIRDIWNLDIDISLKLGGRTVLLVDHLRSKLFSRVENFYAIPENVIEPSSVRNLSLGWCSIARSSIPLHLTKLYLYSVDVIDSVKKDLDIIFRNSNHLRELRMWNFPCAQTTWPLINFSSLPKKLKTFSASFVEIDMGVEAEEFMDLENSVSPCSSKSLSPYGKSQKSSILCNNNLENICLFMYELKTEDSEVSFFNSIAQCKRVSLINFPPYKLPTQSELFFLMQSNTTSQILFGLCEHHLNVHDHWLYLRKDVLENIQNARSFVLNKNEPFGSSYGLCGGGGGLGARADAWNGKAISQLELNQHLSFQFGFDDLYSFDSFMQQEAVTKLVKSYVKNY